MEVRPATLAQVSQARNGAFVQVDDDVQGVANGLHEVDPHIRLRFSEAGGYYVIYWTEDPNVAEEDDVDGNSTYLIFTAQDLDHRIVKHMEEVYWRCRQPGYSFASELDKAEAEGKKQESHEWSERHGEMFEKMAYAMRKDLGYDQSRIFVPEGV